MFNKKYMAILAMAMLLCGCSLTNSNTNDNADKNVNNTEMIDATTESPDSSNNGEDVVYYDMNLEQVEPFIGLDRQFRIIGFKEYDKFDSDVYAEVPSDGNKYLVLFVEIGNYTEHDEFYISPYDMQCKIDGKLVQNVGLYNQPEQYDTIFRNIAPYEKAQGYIAWEVPADWSTFSLDYSGFKYDTQQVLHYNLTPNDLFDINTER